MCAFNPPQQLTGLCVNSHIPPTHPDYAYVFAVAITVSVCASSYLPRASTQGISISHCRDGDRISVGEQMRLGINEVRGAEGRCGDSWVRGVGGVNICHGWRGRQGRVGVVPGRRRRMRSVAGCRGGATGS